MKRTKAFMFVVVLAISSFYVVTAQKSDFNGTWKLDRTKSTLAAVSYTHLTLPTNREV